MDQEQERDEIIGAARKEAQEIIEQARKETEELLVKAEKLIEQKIDEAVKEAVEEKVREHEARVEATAFAKKTDEQQATEVLPETDEQQATEVLPETDEQPETEETPETAEQLETDEQPETEETPETEEQPETEALTGTDEHLETEKDTETNETTGENSQENKIEAEFEISNKAEGERQEAPAEAKAESAPETKAEPTTPELATDPKTEPAIASQPALTATKHESKAADQGTQKADKWSELAKLAESLEKGPLAEDPVDTLKGENETEDSPKIESLESQILKAAVDATESAEVTQAAEFADELMQAEVKKEATSTQKAKKPKPKKKTKKEIEAEKAAEKIKKANEKEERLAKQKTEKEERALQREEEKEEKERLKEEAKLQSKTEKNGRKKEKKLAQKNAGLEKQPRSNPLVCVALATFNPNMDQLRNLLKSINEQNYENIKVILWDDCSDEVSKEDLQICLKECITGFVFEIRRNEEQIGIEKTVEKFAEIAKSEYIAYCHLGDVWLPGKIKRYIVETENNDHALICSDTFVIDEDGEQLAESITKVRKNHTFKYGEGLARQLLFDNFVIDGTMMIKTSLAKTAVPFCPNMPYEHYLALYCANEGSIGFVGRPLTKYRIEQDENEKTLGEKTDRASYVAANINQSLEWLKWLERNFNCDEELKGSIQDAMLWALARRENLRPKLKVATEIWRYREFGWKAAVFEIIVGKLPDILASRIIGLRK